MIVFPRWATDGPDLTSLTAGASAVVRTVLLLALSISWLDRKATFSMTVPSSTNSLIVALKVTVPLTPGDSVPSAQVVVLLAGS